MSDTLYHVNDVLTALMHEHGTQISDDDLNDLTHEVAARLGIGQDVQRPPVFTVSRESIHEHAGRPVTDEEAAEIRKGIEYSTVDQCVDAAIDQVITEPIDPVITEPAHGPWCIDGSAPACPVCAPWDRENRLLHAHGFAVLDLLKDEWPRVCLAAIDGAGGEVTCKVLSWRVSQVLGPTVTVLTIDGSAEVEVHASRVALFTPYRVPS